MCEVSIRREQEENAQFFVSSRQFSEAAAVAIPILIKTLEDATSKFWLEGFHEHEHKCEQAIAAALKAFAPTPNPNEK